MVVSIRLTSTQINYIKNAAETAYPMEACGLITGYKVSEKLIEAKRIVNAKNIQAPYTNKRFEVDPGTRIKIEKEIRGTNERLIAHYHSHPDKPAIPSNTDLENAHEPELIWIIVSVNAGKAIKLTAHQVLKDKSGFKEIDLLIK